MQREANSGSNIPPVPASFPSYRFVIVGGAGHKSNGRSVAKVDIRWNLAVEKTIARQQHHRRRSDPSCTLPTIRSTLYSPRLSTSVIFLLFPSPSLSPQASPTGVRQRALNAGSSQRTPPSTDAWRKHWPAATEIHSSTEAGKAPRRPSRLTTTTLRRGLALTQVGD